VNAVCDLSGKVAVVAGATRGAGRGIPVQVDHAVVSQVESLRDRIAVERERVDILVNDMWGGEGKVQWNTPLWKHPLEKGIDVMRNAIESHVITNHFLLPLVLKGEGILFEVSDGTLKYNLENYRCECFYYDISKLAINRLAWAMSRELEPHRSTAMGITPGWLRSEMMLESFKVREENWRDAIRSEPRFAASESPRFVGKAIACLSADPDRRRFNGTSMTSYEVSQIYGFTDLDGTQPDSWSRIAT
jgi:NAD(P)-dependent dehydrogenase (short-subunit alcohol dehydrogenase family)